MGYCSTMKVDQADMPMIEVLPRVMSLLVAVQYLSVEEALAMLLVVDLWEPLLEGLFPGP